MYSIRKYHPKDEENLKNICIKTASDVFQGKKLTETALTEVYCRYYIENEPENCFVVVDQNDETKGYILCAKNYDAYKKIFQEKYLKTWNLATLIMGHLSLRGLQDFAKKYPAHLHIDLLPECQSKGFGSRLIALLIEHLKEAKIPGLMLHVGGDNEGAIRFYKRCGFEKLHVDKLGVLMGMKLMYTKDDLTNDLKNMGLKQTDTIMVHSSMKAIGPVDGGADTVVDVFMEYFKEGLFMTPTHTWAQMSEEYSLFDPSTEPACVGIIPNIFRQREGVVRSLHPTHSIAAYGPRAASYIEGEENVKTPCQPGGCWSRLLEEEAKILMLGCTHIRNTFIHAVEELLDVPERLTEKPVDFQIKMPDGSIKEVSVHRHYNRLQPHISEEYDKLMQAYYDCDAAKLVKFGDADCILCDAKKIYEVTKKVLSNEINCLIDREEIPREWWED